MGSQVNWLAGLLALALEPDERGAVLGDLAEFGASGWRAALEVLGLVVRRQLLIWTNWQPWFALIFIVGVSGFCLSGMLNQLGIAMFEQLTSWRRYGVHYNTGVTSFRDEVIHMSCLAIAIFCWIAVNASLLRRLSGRASWLTGLLFYLTVHNSFTVLNHLSGALIYRGNMPWWATIGWIFPLNAESLLMLMVLFVIPSLYGARGKLPTLVPATVIFTLVAAALGEIRAHDLENFSHGAFPAPHWLAILVPYAFVSWPVLASHRLFRSNGPYSGVGLSQR
jgi:hypothetical protein